MLDPIYVRLLAALLALGAIWTLTHHSGVNSQAGLDIAGAHPFLREDSEKIKHLSGNSEMSKSSEGYDYGNWPPEVLLGEVHRAAENLDRAIALPFDQNKAQVARGIAVYFPASEPQQEKELRGLLLSIAHMRTFQQSTVKTDLVVFSPPRGYAFLESVGCSFERRGSFADSERCVIIEHIPLSERPGVDDPLLSYKRYLDSVLMVAEYKHYSDYDYLMKSDMDTFVTPAFADLRLQPGKVIAVGHGGYGHRHANARLSFIMKETFALSDSGMFNIGTTWFGSPAVLVAACQVSVASMRWLDRMEFTEYERTHPTTDTWPLWYWPVLTMYGGHISINQIGSDKVMLQQENVIEMDFGSDYATDLRPSIKHIHCWHTANFFSKFAFASGQYDAMDLTEHAEMKSAPSYSAVIALSAVRLSIAEFKAIISDPVRVKNGEWKRLKVDR